MAKKQPATSNPNAVFRLRHARVKTYWVGGGKYAVDPRSAKTFKSIPLAWASLRSSIMSSWECTVRGKPDEARCRERMREHEVVECEIVERQVHKLKEE